jgi:hypothetical protein
MRAFAFEMLRSGGPKSAKRALPGPTETVQAAESRNGEEQSSKSFSDAGRTVPDAESRLCFPFSPPSRGETPIACVPSRRRAQSRYRPFSVTNVLI